jgi:hypothetical protein
MAGVGEELLVLALPYLVLTRIRFRDRPIPSTAVMALLVALRMSYHVYYGWSALSLLPWAITSVAVFARYQRVWPLILTHTVYDLVLLSAAGSATAGIGLLAGLVTSVVLLFGLGRTRINQARAAGHSPA